MNTDIESLLKSLSERVAADPNLAGLPLLSLVRPSIRLATQFAPHDQIGIGESRIGGIPDVPPGFEWPYWDSWRQRNDKYIKPKPPRIPTPLGFIAQIDLSAIPRFDDTLPSSGWLYFFYDRLYQPGGYNPIDRGCCRVIYADCDRSTLTRTEPPSDADPVHFARPCRVDTWLELTIPDDLPEIEYGTPAYEVYWGLRDELIDTDGWQHNRLLGHPQIIQTPMELQCQLASHGVYDRAVQQAELEALSPGAADWRLLLQIDSDEEGPGWMWGDVGRIYFWIKRQDLHTLRFDDVWLILQCT